MASASKQSKITFLGEEEILSLLENDEWAISDSEIEYLGSESNDDENDVQVSSSDLRR